MSKKQLTDIVDNLVDVSAWIIEQKIKMAKGQEPDSGYHLCDTKAQIEIMSLIKPHIESAKQTTEIVVNCTADILTLLVKGKITIEQAIKLMELMKVQQDIEELPKLTEAMEKLVSGGDSSTPPTTDSLEIINRIYRDRFEYSILRDSLKATDTISVYIFYHIPNKQITLEMEALC